MTVFANFPDYSIRKCTSGGVGRACILTWLVPGDNLETTIVVVAVGKFALSEINSFTFVCPQHGSLLMAAVGNTGTS